MTKEQTRHRAGRSGTLKQHARLLLRRPVLLVLSFLVTSQCAFATRFPGFRADAAEAVVDITRRDVGEVFAGEEIEYAFIVRNAGTKPLELKEKPSISGSIGSRNTPFVAIWRPTERLFIRPVAAVRAAPS